MRRIWLGLVVLLAGCGGGGAKDFEGTWNINSGSESITCTANGQSNTQTSTESGNQSIVAGTDSDIVMTDSGGCNLKMNVSGSLATALPNQTCTSNGVTITWTSATLTLSSDKKSVTFTASISSNTTQNGVAVACSGTINGAASKIGS